MTYLEILTKHIEANGPIKTARVSSAQSATKYSYWGAARYEIRITKAGHLSNVALERASSDRRSKRLAQQDCDALCEREGRIYWHGIGRLTERDAALICQMTGAKLAA